LSGIKFEVMARSALERMSEDEVVEYVIRRAKEGSVVVFEGQLSPQVLTKIIEEAMKNVDLEEFKGVDIHVVPPKTAGGGIIKKIFGRKFDTGITVISPAGALKDLKKGEDYISLKLG